MTIKLKFQISDNENLNNFEFYMEFINRTVNQLWTITEDLNVLYKGIRTLNENISTKCEVKSFN